MTNALQRKFVWTMLAAGAAAAVILLVGILTQTSQAQEGNSMNQRTITVIGTGSANGVPDTVYISFGVDRFDRDIDSAVTGARETLRSIVAAVREAGVEERDIQTAYYNVFPEERFDPSTGAATGERQFRVSLGISVTVRNVDNATPTITAALNAGATSVQNLSFGIADTRPLQSEARTAAVADARARAQELATIFGVTLGDVVTINESFGGGAIPYDSARMDSGMGGNNQIVPGQLGITSSVQVTFAISG
jgi:uncharacterized protein